MTLTINPKNFLEEFVSPILELNKDGKTAIFAEDEELNAVSATTNNAIYFYNTYKPLAISDPVSRFNINLLRLVKGLGCVKSAEDQINLQVNVSAVSFETKYVKFNVKTISDSIVTVPKFNKNVFSQYTFDHTLTLNKSSLSDIKKAMDFSSETGKFYIERDGSCVYLFFGDKSSNNYNDDIRILISEDCTTDLPEKIYDTSILKLIMRAKNDLAVKIANNGVMYIEIENTHSNLKYITTPLIK